MTQRLLYFYTLAKEHAWQKKKLSSTEHYSPKFSMYGYKTFNHKTLLQLKLFQCYHLSSWRCSLNVSKTLYLRLINHRTYKNHKYKPMFSQGPVAIGQEWARAVVLFRHTTGHNYLQLIPHRSRRQWCHSAKTNREHLYTCARLIDAPTDPAARYLAARRQMGERPRTRVR